jgi:hypothetical protein
MIVCSAAVAQIAEFALSAGQIRQFAHQFRTRDAGGKHGAR